MSELGRVIGGRYALFEEFASGGMASIHFGRQTGAAGFARAVAIKRLHPNLAKDPEFVAMFLDEARLAARIRHPNVVSTLDVVQEGTELVLVMEYVDGEPLSGLGRAARRLGHRIPPPVISRIVCDALAGLHAAHQATSPEGIPLAIVHRDVTPSNILVGVDGSARVLDFGVAKAAVRLSSTRQGGLKGKLRYLAPEQLADLEVSQRTDVYMASVMLWEVLVGEPLFAGSNEAAVLARIMEGVVAPPSSRDPALPAAVDAVVLTGLARDPGVRFATARDMAAALERALPPASTTETGEWVQHLAADSIAKRRATLARVEGQGAPGPSEVAQPTPTDERTHTETAPAHAVSSAAAELGEGPTQLASSAHARTEGVPRHAWLLGGTVFSVVFLVGLLIALSARQDRGTAAIPSAPGAASTEDLGGTAPLVATEEGAVPGASPPAAPVASVETTDASAPVASTAPEVASTAPEATPRAPKTTSARPKPAPTPSCDPPYVVDASGRRKVKRECL